MQSKESPLRRPPQGRRHAGNNFVSNVGPPQGFDLFACTSEDQRVSAFQANHAQARVGKSDHEEVDLFLQNFLLPQRLPTLCTCAVGGIELQNLGRDQIVVKHGIGGLQQAQRFQREQFRDRPALRPPDRLCPSSSFSFCSQFARFGQGRFERFPAGQRMQQVELAFLSRSLARMSFRVSPKFRDPFRISGAKLFFQLLANFLRQRRTLPGG